MRTALRLITCVAALLAMPVAMAAETRIAALPGSPASACTPQTRFGVDGNVDISSVRWVSAPVPYCRVDGVVRTSDPGPNTVGFMVALPQAWNGRYLMVVPGGSAGYVVNPSNEHLQLGYAVASTDKGSHSTGALDMSFRSDPGRSEDYAHRGAHVAAVATQSITRSYYGRQRLPRYLMGCSGGGLSTLMEAERYPQDADGFIAAAAPTDPYVQTFWAYVAQYVAKDPARWISPREFVRVGQAIMDEYDGADGAKDGLIWDPSRIELKRSLFPFLTDAQFSTLTLLQKGLPPVAGSDVSAPGYWLANPSLLGPIVVGSTPPPWTAQSRPPLYGSTVLSMAALRGPDYDAITQTDFSDPRQRAAEKAIWQKVGGYDLDPARLAALARLGARLIFWSGASDEAIPPSYLTSYSDRIRARFGPGSDAFFQSFLIPGMFHCRGGEGQPTDASMGMLQAMQRWVEAGEHPEQVVLTNASKPIEINSTSNTAQYVSGMSTEAAAPPPADPRSYLICGYPARASFAGNPADRSQVNDSRQWRCSKPKQDSQ
jgi:feruloyl esterase